MPKKAKKSAPVRDRTRVRSRTAPIETQRKIVGSKPHGSSKFVEVTLEDILATGRLPSYDTLEKRFPGISTSGVARRELYMVLIFRLRNLGYTISELAILLDVHPNTINYYLSEVNKALEAEMLTVSFMGQMGRSLATFRALQAEAGKIAYGHHDAKTRLRALRDMAFMENSVLGTLQKGGFFDTNRVTPEHSKDGPKGDVGIMRGLLQQIISGEDMEDVIEAEPVEEETLPLDEKNLSVLRI